jgi:hypothetical protein
MTLETKFGKSVAFFKTMTRISFILSRVMLEVKCPCFVEASDPPLTRHHSLAILSVETILYRQFS